MPRVQFSTRILLCTDIGIRISIAEIRRFHSNSNPNPFVVATVITSPYLDSRKIFEWGTELIFHS